MATRLEINFCRLLKRCETMLAEQRLGDWRMEKYVAALNDQLAELRQSPSKPGSEVLADYMKKLEFLRGLIEAEKMPSASDKSLASHLLVPGTMATSEIKELHLQTKSRHQGAMRDELLAKQSDDPANGLRRRKSPGDSKDIDTVLKHHHRIQERLAEDMVTLARGMKETASAANRVIKEDNKRLTESSKLTDTNYSKLKVESERLEAHTRKACNVWLWMTFVVVCLTFIWTIVFMRMFPKK